MILKILLIILLLLLGLLLLPLRFVLGWREELQLELGIFFWHKTLLPQPEKAPEAEAKKESPNKKKEEKESPKKPKKKLDSGQLLELLSLAKTALQSLGRPLGWFLGKLKLRDLWLDLTIVQEDAHQTALRYGQIQAALHSLLGLLDTRIRWKPEDLQIRADFVGQEERLWGGFSLTLRPIWLLIFGLWFLGRFVKKLIQDWWTDKKLARQLSKQTSASNGKD